ncbi:MAG: hypothetical protein ABH875_04240, partial [Candidatus Omnitrophota bacterium]
LALHQEAFDYMIDAFDVDSIHRKPIPSWLLLVRGILWAIPVIGWIINSSWRPRERYSLLDEYGFGMYDTLGQAMIRIKTNANGQIDRETVPNSWKKIPLADQDELYKIVKKFWKKFPIHVINLGEGYIWNDAGYPWTLHETALLRAFDRANRLNSGLPPAEDRAVNTYVDPRLESLTVHRTVINKDGTEEHYPITLRGNDLKDPDALNAALKRCDADVFLYKTVILGEGAVEIGAHTALSGTLIRTTKRTDKEKAHNEGRYVFGPQHYVSSSLFEHPGLYNGDEGLFAGMHMDRPINVREDVYAPSDEFYDKRGAYGGVSLIKRGPPGTPIRKRTVHDFFGLHTHPEGTGAITHRAIGYNRIAGVDKDGPKFEDWQHKLADIKAMAERDERLRVMTDMHDTVRGFLTTLPMRAQFSIMDIAVKLDFKHDDTDAREAIYNLMQYFKSKGLIRFRRLGGKAGTVQNFVKMGSAHRPRSPGAAATSTATADIEIPELSGVAAVPRYNSVTRRVEIGVSRADLPEDARYEIGNAELETFNQDIRDEFNRRPLLGRSLILMREYTRWALHNILGISPEWAPVTHGAIAYAAMAIALPVLLLALPFTPKSLLEGPAALSINLVETFVPSYAKFTGDGPPILDPSIDRVLADRNTKHVTILSAKGNFASDSKAKHVQYRALIGLTRKIMRELVDDADFSDIRGRDELQDGLQLEEHFLRERLASLLEGGDNGKNGIMLNLVYTKDEVRGLPIPGLMMMPRVSHYGHYSTKNDRAYVAGRFIDDQIERGGDFLSRYASRDVEVSELADIPDPIRQAAACILHEVCEYMLAKSILPHGVVIDSLEDPRLNKIHLTAQFLEIAVAGPSARGDVTKSALDDTLADVHNEYWQNFHLRANTKHAAMIAKDIQDDPDRPVRSGRLSKTLHIKDAALALARTGYLPSKFARFHMVFRPFHRDRAKAEEAYRSNVDHALSKYNKSRVSMIPVSFDREEAKGDLASVLYAHKRAVSDFGQKRSSIFILDAGRSWKMYLVKLVRAFEGMIQLVNKTLAEIAYETQLVIQLQFPRCGTGWNIFGAVNNPDILPDGMSVGLDKQGNPRSLADLPADIQSLFFGVPIDVVNDIYGGSAFLPQHEFDRSIEIQRLVEWARTTRRRMAGSGEYNEAQIDAQIESEFSGTAPSLVKNIKSEDLMRIGVAIVDPESGRLLDFVEHGAMEDVVEAVITAVNGGRLLMKNTFELAFTDEAMEHLKNAFLDLRSPDGGEAMLEKYKDPHLRLFDTIGQAACRIISDGAITEDNMPKSWRQMSQEDIKTLSSAVKGFVDRYPIYVVNMGQKCIWNRSGTPDTIIRAAQKRSGHGANLGIAMQNRLSSELKPHRASVIESYIDPRVTLKVCRTNKSPQGGFTKGTLVDVPKERLESMESLNDYLYKIGFTGLIYRTTIIGDGTVVIGYGSVLSSSFISTGKARTIQKQGPDGDIEVHKKIVSIGDNHYVYSTQITTPGLFEGRSGLLLGYDHTEEMGAPYRMDEVYGREHADHDPNYEYVYTTLRARDYDTHTNLTTNDYYPIYRDPRQASTGDDIETR